MKRCFPGLKSYFRATKPVTLLVRIWRLTQLHPCRRLSLSSTRYPLTTAGGPQPGTPHLPMSPQCGHAATIPAKSCPPSMCGASGGKEVSFSKGNPGPAPQIPTSLSAQVEARHSHHRMPLVLFPVQPTNNLKGYSCRADHCMKPINIKPAIAISIFVSSSLSKKWKWRLK